MTHSLRLRLLVALVVVLVTTVGLMALFINQSTASEFHDYISQTQSLNISRLADRLRDEYTSAGNWDSAQPLIEQLGQVVGGHIILLDTSDRIVADSQNRLAGNQIYTAATPVGPFTQALPAGQAGPVLYGRPPRFPIRLEDGTVVGLLLVFPGPSAREDNFLDGVNKSLLLAGAIAAAGALLLTLLLSRRILRPIEALTRAARRMERGDLSGRVQVQTKDEIGELGRAFNRMADGLARQEELRRNMVSDVSHELRSPLSNLRGYLEALRDGVLEPEPELLASLHDETLVLSRLVEDLQELALAEARQLRLEREPTDAAALITQVAGGFRQAAAEKEVNLSLALAPGLPRVFADPNRIGQVIRNLLSNALTYTAAGGSVTVGAARAGDMLEISVRDSGSGIAPEHLEHIFDRFFRADPARARATGGSGLGLAIVKQLVEMHGGTVSATSTLGVGSTFTFTLPLTGAGKKAVVKAAPVVGQPVRVRKPVAR